MKICLLDAQTLGKDIDLSELMKLGDVTIYDLTDNSQVAERIKDADVIITNKVILNEENLHDAKKLRLIALTATGYNNVAIHYAKQKGIGVANVAGYSTQSVTQHTFALLFYLLEKIRLYDDYVKNKQYEQCKTFSYLAWSFNEISDKVWGIIGMGSIGKKVAEIAKSFGAKVIYYSASGENNHEGYQRVTLDELLKLSDILSIHAPLTDNTKDLLTYNELKQMKKTALLLNLGRGGIVNEKDLARALNENLICGAGLDVLEDEPIKSDNPLYTVKDTSRLLITPHIAWASIEARKALINEVIENIKAFQRNELRNRVV